MADFSAVPIGCGRRYRATHVPDLAPTSLSDSIGHRSITINTNRSSVGRSLRAEQIAEAKRALLPRRAR